MAAGFFRVFFTGVPLLLAATTTPTLALAADAHGYAPEELTFACGAEIAACQGDETCTSCSSVPEGSRAEFGRCSDAATADAPDSSSNYCLSNVADVCCLNDISEKECLENDQFVNYSMCKLDADGCLLNELACGHDWVKESVSVSSSSSGIPAAELADGSTAIA